MGVFKAFKHFYYEEVNQTLCQNPGVPITTYDVAKCVERAVQLSFTPLNIISVFLKSAIFLFNKLVFQDLALSSAVIRNPLQLFS